MLQVSYGRFAPTITPGQDLPCKALSSPPHTEWCHPAEAAGLLKPKAAPGGAVGSPDMGGTAATELCMARKQGGVGHSHLPSIPSCFPPASFSWDWHVPGVTAACHCHQLQLELASPLSRSGGALGFSLCSPQAPLSHHQAPFISKKTVFS